MRFGLVTDIHFGPEAGYAGQLRKLGRFAEPLLEQFVRESAATGPLDLVVNLGDVLEDESALQDEAQYRRFLGVLGKLECPVLHVAGNHDLINIGDDELVRLWGRRGGLFYSEVHAGIRFVVLCCRHDRGIRVVCPAEQLSWLQAELQASQEPVVVLVHHPVGEMDLTGNHWFERARNICLVENRRAVRDVLRACGKVVAVFNGHVHWNHLFIEAGIPYVTLQSLTENVAPADEDPRPAASYALVELAQGKLQVVIFGQQPVRFELSCAT